MAINKTWLEGIFVRASAAYTSRGEKRPRNTPRYLERIINLLTTNQASAETDTTGFQILGTGVTISRDTTKYWHGAASIKVVCDGTVVNQGVQVYISKAAGIAVNYAGQVKITGTGSVLVTVGGNVDAGTNWQGTTLSLNALWQEGTSVRTSGINDTVFYLMVYTLTAQAITFWIDGLQLESGNLYVTSWQLPGSAGNIDGVQGIMVEEETTNPLSANQSSVETDTAGFTAFDSTISRDTVEKWHGAASLKVVTSGLVNYEGVYTNSVAVDASSTHTVNARVKGSGNLRILIEERDSVDALIGVTVVFFAASSTWTRYSVSRAFGSTGVKARLIVATDGTQGVTFYIDGLQIEKKAYATSWHIGGTARVAEVPTVPSSVFRKGNWAIKLTFTPTSDQTAVTNTIWSIPIDDNNRYQLYTSITSGKLGGWVRSGGINYLIAGTEALQVGTSYSIMFSGNGSIMRLCVNGAQMGNDLAYVEPVGTLPANMTIGCGNWGLEQANGIISDFAVTLAQTLADHQVDYNSGKPLRFDAKTTALMPLAGNLKVYTKRLWVETNDQGAWILQPIGATILEGSDLPVSPGFRKYREEADNVPGSIDFGGEHGDQPFDFICDVRKTNSEKFDYKHKLSKWLDAKAGFQELSWEEDPVSRCLLVRPEGGIKYANKFNALKFRIPFEGKTFWESTATNWLWGTGDAENRGNEEAPCLISFYDACTDPNITINGVTVQYTGVLVDGDKVEVDTGAITAKKTAADGAVTNVLNSMGVNFPKLQPGLSYISTTFFASLQWRDRWI